MFLKSVTNAISRFLVACYQPSITRRLTILYALSTFFALLTSSIFLYRVLVNDLYNADLKIIDNEIALVKNVLQTHHDKLIMLDPQANEEKTYYIRVLDDKHKTLLETPDMRLQFSSDDFAPPPADGSFSHVKTVKSLDDIYYMTRTATVSIPEANGNLHLSIQMALDTNHHHAIKLKYQIRLAIIVIVGMFISALLGIFIAYKGMKPLRKLAQKIQTIGAHQLHERVPMDKVPQELTVLIKAFNALLARIQHAFSQLNQFSADIAHELRTPIHHLMVETEICLSQARSLEDYQETLHSNLEEYNSLAQLIDKLLFLARSEYPHTGIKLSSIDINKEFRLLSDFYQVLCEEKNIQLTTFGTGHLEADPILFKRALSNLLSNAVKHTPADGKISLIATEEPDYHIIQVIDSGTGIDATHLKHLFDRFYRVDYARSKQTAKGHGLGLAIVKSIMHLHRGKVEVSSHIGKGTTFTLYFPKS